MDKQERIPLNPDGFPSASYIHKLPCGASSNWEGCGWRCHDCFAIYGSMGCSCSREDEPKPEQP